MALYSSRRLSAAFLATTVLTFVPIHAFAQVEEIIVTTRKRAENLQDVPIVVTAFSAETLQRKGLAELEDIIKYTSGVQFDEGFSAQDTRVVVRGLSPTRGRPNVAFLMDDVDISSEAINTAGSSFLINPRLFDVERVEIVKGPHSALFGRSAFAGAINYITKKPGDEFEGRAAFEAATHGKFEAKASVSGPVVADVLSLGLNVAGWTFDGYYKNSLTGQNVGGGKGAGISGAAVWKPADAVKVTARSEYSDDEFDPQARAQMPANAFGTIPANAAFLSNARLNGVFPILTGAAPQVRKNNVLIRMSPDPRTGVDYSGNHRQLFRSTVRVDFDFEQFTISSISHYGRGATYQFEDAQRQGDFNTSTIAAETNFDTVTKLKSQELRVQSEGEGPFTWTVGGLYWDELVRQNNHSFTCFTPTGVSCGPLVRQVGTSRPFLDELYFRDTMHHSVYGLFEYDVTESLGLSLEIRHTWEDEDLTAPGTVSKGIGCAAPFRSLQLPAAGATQAFPPNPAAVLRCAAQFGPFVPTFNNVVANYIFPETKSKFWAPRFGIDYRLNDDALLYASAAKGIKPGGVSTLSGGAAGIDAATNRYEAEKLWVYELGAKTDWLDNALQLNAAAYYQDFSDKQASTQILLSTGVVGTRIINAAAARVWGVDLEGGWAVSDNMTVSLGYTWLDAKYKDFKTTQQSLSTVTNAGNCNPLNNQLQPVPAGSATAFTCEIDLSGNKLEDTPTHSLQFSPSWRAPIADGLDYFLEASVQYNSKRFDTEFNNFFFSSYWNTDLRAGLTSEEGGWELTAFVTNLFNDDKIKTGFASPDFNRSYCLGGAPCNIPPIPPLGAGRFVFVLPNHFTASLPDKRQFGVRASYKF
ncbi:MAG: TonB-dependent receptor [Rhodospirillaceae bacterium]|nr:TonB-dependent receptor [Rhodospirillaceae bacterium]